jgi:O-antigen/teichoic acid export membrane protein
MNAAAVAAYAIPFQIAFRMLIFPRSLVNALFPRLASTSHDASQALTRDFAVFVGQAFAIPVIALIAAFSPLLSLWLGAQLDPRSVSIGLILLPGIWFTAIAIIPHSQVQARGDSRYTALFHLVQLPIYLGLLWWLGSQYGLAGFAAAFSLRCLVEQLVYFKKVQIADRTVLIGLAVPTLLVFLAVVVSSEVEQWEVALGLGGLLAFIATGFAVVAMPKSIRSALLASPLRRYLKPILR